MQTLTQLRYALPQVSPDVGVKADPAASLPDVLHGLKRGAAAGLCTQGIGAGMQPFTGTKGR
ncbi:protein of unknown function [Escherichia coli]|nr:protein of unknown function [Escherichia coli]